MSWDADKSHDSNPHQFQWNNELIHTMMWLYKTRKCPRWKKKRRCPHGGKYCFDSHESYVRRRPHSDGNGNWNYCPSEKCHTGYRDPFNCNDGKLCFGYHCAEELRYHPTRYKTMLCNDPGFVKDGVCTRGPICWQYHSENEKLHKDMRSGSMQSVGLNRKDPAPNTYIEWANQKIARERVKDQPSIASSNQLSSE